MLQEESKQLSFDLEQALAKKTVAKEGYEWLNEKLFFDKRVIQSLACSMTDMVLTLLPSYHRKPEAAELEKLDMIRNEIIESLKENL